MDFPGCVHNLSGIEFKKFPDGGPHASRVFWRASRPTASVGKIGETPIFDTRDACTPQIFNACLWDGCGTISNRKFPKMTGCATKSSFIIDTPRRRPGYQMREQPTNLSRTQNDPVPEKGVSRLGPMILLRFTPCRQSSEPQCCLCS